MSDPLSLTSSFDRVKQVFNSNGETYENFIYSYLLGNKDHRIQTVSSQFTLDHFFQGSSLLHPNPLQSEASELSIIHVPCKEEAPFDKTQSTNVQSNSSKERRSRICR